MNFLTQSLSNHQTRRRCVWGEIIKDSESGYFIPGVGVSKKFTTPTPAVHFKHSH